MKIKLMRKIIPLTAVVCFACVCAGDTFENVSSGETFNGFATQKVKQGKTFVYDEAQGKFQALSLSKWRVTYNALGRRNTVTIVRLDSPEILLSKVISDSVADSIIDASNKGPLAIIIEIDLPGGRGEYTKSLSDVIKRTNNCPVIAFINSGDDGGAYSAATALAFACDKIYISSSAVIGSDAPMTDAGRYYGDAFSETFNSVNLAAYKGYIATLAESKGRTSIIAMAMLDSQIDVIEVKNKEGQKSFVNRQNRVPSQTILRSWSSQKIGVETAAGNVKRMTLVLQPKDAVYAKIADAVVDSREDILDDLGASEAKLLRTGNKIKKSVKKFVATRRNLSSVIANIDYLRGRSEHLTSQLEDIQQESSRTRERVIDTYVPTVKRPFDEREVGLKRGRNASPNTRTRRRAAKDTEVVIETSAGFSNDELLDDLSVVLIDLTRDYNRAIVLGRRFPGALPVGMTVGSLEKELYAANALYDDVAYRR